MKYFKLLFSIILLFTLACNSNEKTDCEAQYKRAANLLTEYYMMQDKTKLENALLTADSISCDSMKYRLSNIKIPAYILLQRYSEGIKYIESLEPEKFERPYTRNMYLNNFKALASEQVNDSAGRDRYYKLTQDEIELYLEDHNEFPALVDLIVIKSKTTQKNILLSELDSISKLNKYDADKFEALYESIDYGYYGESE